MRFVLIPALHKTSHCFLWILFFFAITLPCNSLYSQPIVVNSTGGTFSANYTSLTQAGGAFSAINAGIHTGTITISVTSDVITEDGANALNASGSGSAFYTSLLIQPFGGYPERFLVLSLEI
jgi:hypothetical protein